MKKFLFVLGVIILIIAIATGIWFFFLSGGADQDDQNPFENNIQFGSFFDNQGQVDNVFNGTYDDLDPEDFVRETRMPILRQISSEPIAGFTFFEREFEVIDNENLFIEDSEEESSTDTLPEENIEPPTTTENKLVFRFMERANGHISETVEDSLTIEKITNTTIQKVNSAIFSGDGSRVLIEKLNEEEEGIDTFIAEIIEETTIDEDDRPISVFKLENQPYSTISGLFTPSPEKNLFAYIDFIDDSSSILINSFSLDSKEEIVNIPPQEIILDWPNQETITITTKASSGQPGYSYLLNVNTGDLSKIIGGVFGLTTKLSPEGEILLFSRSTNNEVKLNTKSVEGKEEKQLSISTLPEKCVFSTIDQTYMYCAAQSFQSTMSMPESWYQGKILFDDLIWRVDLLNGSHQLFYTFDAQTYGLFDIVDMEITEDDKYLVFKNKRDLTLWSLNIEELNNEAGFNFDLEDSPEGL